MKIFVYRADVTQIEPGAEHSEYLGLNLYYLISPKEDSNHMEFSKEKCYG